MQPATPPPAAILAVPADRLPGRSLGGPVKPATAPRKRRRRSRARNRDGIVIEDLWAARGTEEGMRWLVRVRDKVARKYLSKAYADEDLAKGEEWGRQQLARFTLGLDSARSADLADVGAEYLTALESRTPRPHRNTFGRTRVLLAELAAAGVADLKAKNFRARVERYFADLKTDRTRGSTGLMAPATKFARFRVLRTLVNFALERDRITVNPLKGVSLFSPVDQRRPTFDISEARRVVALDRRQDVAWLWVVLLLYTGMRREESLALDWEDLDWSSRLIRVRRGKGNRSRVVPMMDEFQEIFAPLGAPDIGPRPTGQIFAVGGLADRTWWTFRRVLTDAAVTIPRGIDPISGVPQCLSPHACRHTYAALRLATGDDSLALALALGHSQSDQTKHYAQQVATYQRQVTAEAWPRGQFRLLPQHIPGAAP
ncbi:MAG TPA: site-specific integrase [Planctomycetota bacterium]|nr:site-specific integrase [Planctomycetota bacterium]